MKAILHIVVCFLVTTYHIHTKMTVRRNLRKKENVEHVKIFTFFITSVFKYLLFIYINYIHRNQLNVLIIFCHLKTHAQEPVVSIKKQILNMRICVASTFPSTPQASNLCGSGIHITTGCGSRLY